MHATLHVCVYTKKTCIFELLFSGQTASQTCAYKKHLFSWEILSPSAIKIEQPCPYTV